ncbi:MAG: hypothetical protein R3B48_07290 [Kofleriaceae bacterium]
MAVSPATWLPALGCVSVLVATSAPVEADGADEVRLALVDLPSDTEAAQVEVRTELATAGGQLAAGSGFDLGLGAGFVLAAGGVVREHSVGGQLEHQAALDGGLGFQWGVARRSRAELGYQRDVGAEAGGRVRGRLGTRSTGSTWLALALEVGMRDRLDGTVAAAAGAGEGPVTPAVELKGGRCPETCAMGSVGVRVRLPRTFALGLAVVGDALPAREVGMTLSLGWNSGGGDDRRRD